MREVGQINTDTFTGEVSHTQHVVRRLDLKRHLKGGIQTATRVIPAVVGPSEVKGALRELSWAITGSVKTTVAHMVAEVKLLVQVPNRDQTTGFVEGEEGRRLDVLLQPRRYGPRELHRLQAFQFLCNAPDHDADFVQFGRCLVHNRRTVAFPFDPASVSLGQPQVRRNAWVQDG